MARQWPSRAYPLNQIVTCYTRTACKKAKKFSILCFSEKMEHFNVCLRITFNMSAAMARDVMRGNEWLFS